MNTARIQSCIAAAGVTLETRHEAWCELAELERLAGIGESIEDERTAANYRANATQSFAERQAKALERIADSLGKGDIPQSTRRDCRRGEGACQMNWSQLKEECDELEHQAIQYRSEIERQAKEISSLSSEVARLKEESLQVTKDLAMLQCQALPELFIAIKEAKDMKVKISLEATRGVV